MNIVALNPLTGQLLAGEAALDAKSAHQHQVFDRLLLGSKNSEFNWLQIEKTGYNGFIKRQQQRAWRVK